MTTVYVCQRPVHDRPVPASAYDTYADEVVCRPCSGLDGESSYACEFLLHYIPDDLRIHGVDRPTMEVNR